MIRNRTARGVGLVALALFCVTVLFPVQPALATGNSGDDSGSGWVEVLSAVWDAVIGSGDSDNPAPATESADGDEEEGSADIGIGAEPDGG
ncbi:MAG: hypothetical protein K0U98_20850 [Deltaproteobacteria bacterium]|nr:hypothetical protein [Deltaproteobacteria bacterium]